MAPEKSFTASSNLEGFAKFASSSLTWKYIERPMLDKYLVPNVDLRGFTLEAGCGTGRVIEYLTQKGIAGDLITGVDLNDYLLTEARAKYPKSSFISGDIAKVRLPQNFFSTAVCVMVFEYLSDAQLVSATRRIFSSLKSGGMLFFLTTHPIRLTSEDQSLYLKNRRVMRTVPWGGELSFFHRPVSDFINLTRKTGFNIEQVIEKTMPARVKSRFPEKYKNYVSCGAVRLAVLASKPPILLTNEASKYKIERPERSEGLH